MSSRIDRRQLALAHIYPDLAGMSDAERRNVLALRAGSPTSKDLDQDQYDVVMAAYETLLWDRVDRKLVPDPRLCSRCRRPLKPLPDGLGQCPEGCQTRKVYAWTRDYWRRKVPSQGRVNSRHVWKLKQLWALLGDYLPPDKRGDLYLAAVIAHAVAQDEAGRLAVRNRICPSGKLDFQALAAGECHKAIEAVKDKLHYAV